MSIAFDSIILGLQRHGGISNYWARLIDAYQRSWPDEAALVLPRRVMTVDVPKIDRFSVLQERLPTRLSRYLSAPVPAGVRVCHSSYYRVPERRVDTLIVSVYDFTYERYAGGARRAVHRQQKRRSIKAADLVLCISQSTRNDLLNEFPDCDPAKAVVTHLGVDTTRFFPDRQSAPTSCSDYVLFVGQRGGYKRFDLAVAALRDLPGLALGIVGPPLSATERAHLAANLGERWIEFGAVDTDRLRILYSNAHSFIFPSDYEGFGLPLLEAMACGCPVIAAGRSSLPEIAGVAALLAPEQSAEVYRTLIDRVRGTAVREAQVTAGFERIKAFDWNATFAQTFSHYG